MSDRLAPYKPSEFAHNWQVDTCIGAALVAWMKSPQVE
jgi:hypothetical protein